MRVFQRILARLDLIFQEEPSLTGGHPRERQRQRQEVEEFFVVALQFSRVWRHGLAPGRRSVFVETGLRSSCLRGAASTGTSEFHQVISPAAAVGGGCGS